MTKNEWLIVAVITAAVVGWCVYDWYGMRDVPESPPPTPTGDQRIDDVRHLGWLLREHWSWREMREKEGVDLDRLERTALESAERAESDREFLRVLRRFVAGIKDGHAHVTLDGENGREARRWPFTVIEVDEGIVVDGFSPESFRNKTFVRGETILAVDGRNIEDHIREQELETFASTDAARRWRAIRDLGISTQKASIRVEMIRLGETEPIEIVVPCPTRDQPVPHMSWKPNKREVRELENDIGYFRPGNFVCKNPGFGRATPEERDAMVASDYDAYRDVFTRMRDKRGFVLDLRGNPGGTDLLGQALAGHLLEPGFRYYGLSMKMPRRWKVVYWTDEVDGHASPRFTGKLAVLIDERSFSVADNLACCLRDNHPDAVFVGQQTGGGSGAPRNFELPSGRVTVRFCTMRVYAPNGEPVEGRGVVPQLAVRATRRQLLDEVDAGLIAAVRALR